MKTKLIPLSSFIFLFLFVSSYLVFADDFQDGLDAVNRGDYKEAYKLWFPIAEYVNE